MDRWRSAPLGPPASLPADFLQLFRPLHRVLALRGLPFPPPVRPPRSPVLLEGCVQRSPGSAGQLKASPGLPPGSLQRLASSRVVPPGSLQRLEPSLQRLEASPVVAPGSRCVAPASRLVAKTSRLVEKRSPVVAPGSRVVAERPANDDSAVLCCIASALCGFARPPGVAKRPVDRSWTAPGVAGTPAGVPMLLAAAFLTSAGVVERPPARAKRPAVLPGDPPEGSQLPSGPCCVDSCVSCCRRLRRKVVYIEDLEGDEGADGSHEVRAGLAV